jgi:hypothetical protein
MMKSLYVEHCIQSLNGKKYRTGTPMDLTTIGIPIHESSLYFTQY